MGRTLMYSAIGGLAVFVLSAAFLVQSGGGSIAQAGDRSIHDLFLEPERFDGAGVTTEGVLRPGNSGEEFLVTADGLGIIVRSDSLDRLRELEGRKVRISGRFGVDEDAGVFIDAITIVEIEA